MTRLGQRAHESRRLRQMRRTQATILIAFSKLEHSLVFGICPSLAEQQLLSLFRRRIRRRFFPELESASSGGAPDNLPVPQVAVCSAGGCGPSTEHKTSFVGVASEVRHDSPPHTRTAAYHAVTLLARSDSMGGASCDSPTAPTTRTRWRWNDKSMTVTERS